MSSIRIQQSARQKDFSSIARALICGRPGCECQRTARTGHGKTHCPAHDDQHPSLSLTEEGGNVLVHCHAGCSQGDVVEALKARGLWGTQTTQAPQVTQYKLYDVDGQLVAIHERRDLPDGRKSFRWLDPSGKSGLGGRKTSELPLYGVHRLKDHPGAAVLLVEGEKACDALCRVVGDTVIPLATVTGANATPGQKTLSPLFRRVVYLWPDNDSTGGTHMRGIAKILRDGGCTVYWVDWKDAPPKGDAADFVARGGDAAALRGLLHAAKPVETEASRPSRLLTLTAAQILEADYPPPTWLVDGLLPEGGLALLVGLPKQGKSWLALQMACVLSSGCDLWGRDTKSTNCLYLALDDTPRRIQARLKTLQDGGTKLDRERIHFWFPTPGEPIPTLDADGLDFLRGLIQDKKAGLVVIDVISNILPQARKRTESLYHHEYKTLSALRHLANELGVTVLAVHHENKSATDNPLLRVSGTTGFTGAVDTVLSLRRLRGQPGRAELEVIGKDIEDDATKLVLEFQSSWCCLGSASDLAKTEQRQAILDAIRAITEAGGVATPKAIAEELGEFGGSNRIRFLLHKMARQGEVVQSGKGYALPGTGDGKNANTANSRPQSRANSSPGALAPKNTTANTANAANGSSVSTVSTVSAPLAEPLTPEPQYSCGLQTTVSTVSTHTGGNDLCGEEDSPDYYHPDVEAFLGEWDWEAWEKETLAKIGIAKK